MSLVWSISSGWRRLASLPPLLACAHGDMSADFTSRCPVALEGVVVHAVEVPHGGALVFSAPAAHVEEVRRRARRMAARYREIGGIYSDSRVSNVEFVAARASAEDGEGGARVVLVAASEWDAALVRNVAREWAGRMTALRGCPMGYGAAGMVPPPW